MLGESDCGSCRRRMSRLLRHVRDRYELLALIDVNAHTHVVAAGGTAQRHLLAAKQVIAGRRRDTFHQKQQRSAHEAFALRTLKPLRTSRPRRTLRTR